MVKFRARRCRTRRTVRKVARRCVHHHGRALDKSCFRALPGYRRGPNELSQALTAFSRAIRARRTWTNDCYRLLTLLTGHHLPLEDDDFDGVDHATNGDGTLDVSLQALLLEIAPPDLQATVANGLPADLSHEDRHRLAVALAQKRNKVTHIYELVKAYGSDIQLVYDRTDRVWRRREAVAAKHAQDISVNPFSGKRGLGDEYAPFIYAEDPRTDAPEALQARLEELLPGCDETIIDGWLGEDSNQVTPQPFSCLQDRR